jgi:hypothetical protein
MDRRARRFGSPRAGVAWSMVMLPLIAITAPIAEARAESARLFLNCTTECFETFLRQQLSHFDIVRDRYLADLELLIASQRNGAGGTTYTVTLLRSSSSDASRARPWGTGSTDARQITLPPARPASEVRSALLDAVLRLLYRAALGSAEERQFELRLRARANAQLELQRDPWDHWVIIPELTGEGEGGSGYQLWELGAGVTARRVTDRHKLRLRMTYGRSFSSFELKDGSSISGGTQSFEANGVYARSLGTHHAVGATATLKHSEFGNLDIHAHYGPVFEVNLFPYAENASRQLRLVYQLGVWYNDYTEPNRAGSSSELRYYHALSAIADVNQGWGSVQLAAQLNSFVREPSSLRLSVGGQVSLSLFEGLSLELSGETAWVKDQLGVRRRPLEDREVLLFIAEQPTSFTLEATFGFSYAFGSVHDTIVNPRFGRVDLTED